MGRQWLVWLLAAGAILAQPVAGLVGRFGDGAASVVFVSRSPNFYLEPGESIHPSLGAVFSGQWEGSLQVLAAGAYEFNRPVGIDGVSGAKHTLTAGMHAFVAAIRAFGGRGGAVAVGVAGRRASIGSRFRVRFSFMSDQRSRRTRRRKGVA